MARCDLCQKCFEGKDHSCSKKEDQPIQYATADTKPEKEHPLFMKGYVAGFKDGHTSALEGLRERSAIGQPDMFEEIKKLRRYEDEIENAKGFTPIQKGEA